MANPQSNTQISFVAPNVPPLEDGLYTIEIVHTLTIADPPSGDPAAAVFNQTHSIYVKGERFALNPKELHKVFPPDKTQGDYDTVLPHVILKRRTFPWERLPAAASTGSSWLAILTFSTDQAPPVAKRKLADLYPGTTAEGDGTLPQGIYSYGSNPSYNQTTYFLEPGQKPTDLCLCIDLTPQLFSQAPSLTDLAWIAHGRHKIDAAKNIEEDYSVVVGTGVPAPGKPSVAYLVSLEGLGDQLPQDDGTYAAAPAWSAIRLAVLKQWSFQTLPLEVSFEKMLEGLNGGINSNNTQNGDSQLRLPANYTPAAYTPPETALTPPTPFDSGYTVLTDSSSGGAGSWYRGPFIPSVIDSNPADSLSLPAQQAQDLDVSVPVSPPLNRSFSAAWQLGRLIALGDKDFAVSQATWKRNCRLQLNILIRQSLPAAANTGADYLTVLNQALAASTQLQGYLGQSLYTGNSGIQTGLYIPQALVDWMAQLSLLKNVPFDYLVPDASMLPNESIRFFNVDQCWIAAMLDGAWSLERQPGSCFDSVYQPWAQLLNGTLLPSFAAPEIAAFWPACGVLLNSKIMPGYAPGVLFRPDGGVNTLSDVQLGVSTNLVLFDKSSAHLTIHEPPEGVHFGFDMTPQAGFSKTLKYIEISSEYFPPGGSSPYTGEDSAVQVSVPFRAAAGRVVQFDQLASLIQSGLGNPSTYTQAEFSFELTQSVQSVCFTVPGTS